MKPNNELSIPMEMKPNNELSITIEMKPNSVLLLNIRSPIINTQQRQMKPKGRLCSLPNN